MATIPIATHHQIQFNSTLRTVQRMQILLMPALQLQLREWCPFTVVMATLVHMFTQTTQEHLPFKVVTRDIWCQDHRLKQWPQLKQMKANPIHLPVSSISFHLLVPSFRQWAELWVLFSVCSVSLWWAAVWRQQFAHTHHYARLRSPHCQSERQQKLWVKLLMWTKILSNVYHVPQASYKQPSRNSRKCKTPQRKMNHQRTKLKRTKQKNNLNGGMWNPYLSNFFVVGKFNFVLENLYFGI